jgi:hypothetical protein
MLREVPGNERESPRRWFQDETLDLIVWYSPAGDMVGFQLCYRARQEHVLTWQRDSGFDHMRIDDGEGAWGRKMSPILIADGTFNKDAILRTFEEASRTLDPSLARAICDIIRRYPEG